MTEAPDVQVLRVRRRPRGLGNTAVTSAAPALPPCACSRCFQMNMAQAQCCSGCGAELGLIIESELHGSQCPDCLLPLEAMKEPAGTLLACRKCGGQFVEHTLLRSLLEQYETTGLAFPDAPYHRSPCRRPRSSPCTTGNARCVSR